MQLNAGRGFRIRDGWLLMEQERQESTLPELVLDRALAGDDSNLGQKVFWEVGTIRRKGPGMARIRTK